MTSTLDETDVSVEKWSFVIDNRFFLFISVRERRDVLNVLNRRRRRWDCVWCLDFNCCHQFQFKSIRCWIAFLKMRGRMKSQWSSLSFISSTETFSCSFFDLSLHLNGFVPLRGIMSFLFRLFIDRFNWRTEKFNRNQFSSIETINLFIGTRRALSSQPIFLFDQKK